jgi:arylsulfatase A-like enzyme
MAPRRNLVIVLAHGLRSDALGDARIWPLQTPNLEKLARRGLALVASCASPADDAGLLSLLTGLHARQHGQLEQGPIAASALQESWPALLKHAGYHVVGVGRVGMLTPHLSESILVEDVAALEAGPCSYLASMQAKGLAPAIQQQRRQRLRSGPFEPDRLLLEPEDDIDGYIMSRAAEALERMPQDKPWALVVLLTGPANELSPPMLYHDVVDVTSLMKQFVPADLSRLDVLVELDYPRILLQRLEPHSIGRIRADYLGRVSLIDYGVGRLQQAVDERRDASRTWTVLGSDRGYLLGEHGLVGHRSFLAPAIEVPLLIAPPTPVESVMHDGLVSVVDVAATIMLLGGCDLPRAVTGRSLLPLMAGDSLPTTAAFGGLLCEFGRRLMLETERYKVVFDTESRCAIGLYDLLNDAAEKQNLVDTAVGRNLLDSLRWRLGDALLPLRSA